MKKLRTVSLILVFLAFLLLLVSSEALAKRYAVVSEVANIRSGPGTDYDILWKVERYHPVVVIKRSGKWCYFKDFEDDRGWIHSSLLGEVPAVITIKNGCNVRSGPGTGFQILFKVGKGVPFKVLGRKGKWIRVKHADGDRGWIHESLVW